MFKRNPTLDAHQLGEMLKNGRTPGEGGLTYYEQIRARRAGSDEEMTAESHSDESASEEDSEYEDDNDEDDDDADTQHSPRNEDVVDEAGESESAESSPANDNEAAIISFGALAKAQESLAKRKRPDTDISQPNKRFRSGHAFGEADERKAGKNDVRDFARPSKHAPAELSSKKAVSRKRSVVPLAKPDIRDPRFEPISGPLNEHKIKHNYAFLDTYREAEMAELKAEIRKTKDPDAKEKPKRALLAIESRKKAQETKDREQEVLREHRRQERGKVKGGKKPFYLKKGEQKKLALVKKFEGLKGRQVEKVIERRRKKITAKERRGMPVARRGVEEA